MYESGSVSHPVFSNSLQLHGLYPTRLLCLWGFSKLEYWSGLPLPSQGDLSNPGIQPRFLALQADSLLSEPPENIYIHKYLYFRVNGTIMQLFLHNFPNRVTTILYAWAFLVTQTVKNLPAMQETQVQSPEKVPWRRRWQPTPVFLPGESHGQRSLVGYSPWGCKELDTTEPLTLSLHFNAFSHVNI